ncbi:hypothetical protein PMAYCL1PPCAC_11535, partial [Pristionchus mayeri]
AETSNEFIDRFNVIAEGIAEAVGVMSNCSNSIFEKFVKGEKDATFANLKGCVKDKVDFEKSFKTPLKNYQEQFKKLVEAEEAALNTVSEVYSFRVTKLIQRVNATRTSLKEKADKIGAKLEQFGKNMLTKLKEFGVTVKESDFVQGMKKAMDDMKERVKSMFEKVKNFFEW